MIKISKILEILSSKLTLFIVIAGLIFLLFRQCDVSAEAKDEADRNYRNYIAQNDSIKSIKSEMGSTISEKAALELKYKELSKEQKKIIAELELVKGKKPKTVIEYKYVYIDSIVEIPVFMNPDTSLSFVHNPDLPGDNDLKIDVKIPYTLELDSTLDESTNKFNFKPLLFADKAQLNISQKVSLTTGLYRNPKDGMLYVRISTKYPNITFNDIKALDIVDTETRKALRDERKSFGIGFNAGYGLLFSENGYSSGPMIGVGIYYSPKWLQFGK